MKTKKIPNIIKVTIVLAIIAVVFLGISITSSVLSVKRAENSINKIGDVLYDSETEDKIDLAVTNYKKLDTNIGLDKRVNNISILNDAKHNYVRLAIKKAIVLNNRKIADNISEEEISVAVNIANEKLKKYFSSEEFESVAGYDEFKVLLEKYETKNEEKENNSGTSNQPAEEPEIC